MLLFALNGGFIPVMTAFGVKVSALPWQNLLCTHALGWAFLLLATFRLRAVWQDRPEGRALTLRARWNRFWERMSYGSRAVRTRLRDRLLHLNPFLWLALRNRLRTGGVWITTGFMVALTGFAYLSSGGEPMLLFSFSIGLAIFHQFLACSLGAAQIVIEQEQGTLEMLLSTPLTVRKVIDGQLHAALRQLRIPALVVLSMHLCAWLALTFGNRFSPWAGPTLLISAMFYLFNTYTALWLAMLGAATTSDPKRASGAAAGRLIGAPLLVCATVTISTAVLNLLFSANIEMESWFVIPSILFLVVGNNLYWLRRTRRDLPDLLARYAFRRYAPEEKLGFLGRLGRELGKWFRPSPAFN